MGTVFSFAVVVGADGADAGPDRARAAVGAAVRAVRRLERAWSPFRDGTLVGRTRRGETLRPDRDDPDGDLDLAGILGLCAVLRDRTRGAFDPWSLPGGFDPTGLVKGRAVERAVAELRRHGLRDVAVGGGGDVVVRGDAPGRRGWRVGVRDPRAGTGSVAVARPDGGLLATVSLAGPGAVATSGTSERGRHVLDPRTGRPARGLLQATVVGPDLAAADALATALLAAGDPAPPWLADLPGHRVVALTEDGLLVGDLPACGS